MKRCKERRTITRALVLYQRLGLCECSSFPFLLYKKIEGVCGKNKSLGVDLFSLHETLLFLNVLGESDILEAIDYVYFKPFQKSISKRDQKNEISYRVIKYANKNHMDERTVYRKLQKAKRIFFAIRELNKTKTEQ